MNQRPMVFLLLHFRLKVTMHKYKDLFRPKELLLQNHYFHQSR
jgi:hypothetical protein